MTAASSPADRFAVIGIGCRFPGGANDHRSYWRNLLAGKDCLTPTPRSRYDTDTLASREATRPGRLVGGRGGYIDGFDEFDPGFFGISPREADHMDPQQRKLLEVSWEALEDGGQRPGDLAGTDVGVFVGAFTLDYKILQFSDLGFETIAAHTATGTMMTMVSNRISYCLDLRGPSLSLDTACSSSLVAVHLACESLRRGESRLALAGGALLHLAPQYTIAETKGGFLSPAGRSRTFDAAADGYVRAEGVAMIALKRLADAQRDGDPIHALVIGSGVNQDGRTNGITVPNPDAQVRLISRVCAQAGITPGELQYVEAHGTSTPVGDPIEAAALGRALEIGRAPGEHCYVGSVKTNIGHTEAAAGIAGLIKTVLALKHGVIPPHINLSEVNPAIDLAAMPYRIPTTAVPWPLHQGPARAGVNSFGFGGTNAHVLLEQAGPGPVPQTRPRPDWTLLPLSGERPQALSVLAAGIRQELAHGARPEDVAHTLAHRRQQHAHRRVVVYRDRSTLEAALAACTQDQEHPDAPAGTVIPCPGPVWVFTGMGPQWWGMGQQLFAAEPVYRAVVEEIDALIRAQAGWCLIDEMRADETASRMSQTWLAQPANLAVQAGLAALWNARGVEAAAVLGHSTGEIAAFLHAGVYSLADAVRVALHRSRLQQKLVGTGTMLAVGLDEESGLRVAAEHGDRVSVAAVNSPAALTLAGAPQELSAIRDRLGAEGVFAKFLDVQVPYHSIAMEEIKDELLTGLSDLTARTAQLPLYLTARPGRATGPELDASYWWDNVRGRVRFRSAIDAVAETGQRVFLEIGPHPVLAHSIRECLPDAVTIPSIRRLEDEQACLTRSLARLHTLGVPLDWDALQPDGVPVSLPPYPFRRDRHWIEPEPVARVRTGRQDHPLLGIRTESSEPLWSARPDLETLPYLSDHRIQSVAVFPAAAYVEMAVQAGRALTGGTGFVTADLELRRALYLSDDPARPAPRLQLAFSREDSSFTVSSETGVHAHGILRALQSRPVTPRWNADRLREQATCVLDSGPCYQQLTQIGYHYGPAFQGIAQVWIGPDQALARIRRPEVLPVGTADDVHPVLLDSCFQALLTPLLLTNAQDPVYLPSRIAEIRMESPGDEPFWAQATITERHTESLTGDIQLYTDDGRLLGQILGLQAQRVDEASGTVSSATVDTWLAELRWHELPPAPTIPSDAGERWLLLADAGGTGADLAEQLIAAGQQVQVLVPGTPLPPDVSGYDHVVHLWGLDASAPETMTASDLRDSTALECYSLITLAQALLGSASARLHVITRGAQAVIPGDPANPAAARVWGVGRVLRHQELPQHRGRLIDLDPGVASGPEQITALLRELQDPELEDDEIALRGTARLTSRLRPAAADLPQALPLSLRADGSYLVTGAFGALGQVLCRFLVARGARRLILLARTRLPEREQWPSLASENPSVRFVRELEAAGAQVALAPVSITDEEGLRTWLAGYRARTGMPIRGVFHLAAQVHDVLLPQMDRGTFEAVHDPKAVGAWLLHQLLVNEPLEHFVLFSSMASLLTTAGQTNYAAGNAFLDALAHHRRGLGLPATSICWGPWATGMIKDLGLVDHYRDARGMSALTPAAGMAVLERLLGQDRAQFVIVTVVDWPVFHAWYPVPPPLVSELAATAGPAVEVGTAFLDRFRDCPAQQRPALVTEAFTAAVASVLHVPAERLSLQDGLTTSGLDSLLAMELRARVATEFQVSLPVMALLSGAGVADLAGQLCDLLSSDPSGAVAAPDTDIEVFTDPDRFPLTQNQKALWFLKQLNPDGFAYNIGGAVQVHAPLRPELMLEAARQLVARHPLLRAAFEVRDGRPQQRIRDPREVAPDLAVFDVPDLAWDEIYPMIIREYRRPYDLEHDPLVRFRLFRRADDRWVLMKAVHHIVSDAVSTFTYIQELLDIYEGLRRGEPVTLPPVGAHYLDFLNWQNRFLAGPGAARQLAYWKQHLPEPIPVLELPTDRPRPPVQTTNGASEFFVLDTATSARVHALAREHDVTVFVVLMAAYYLLLHRYSGQDDIVVGTPVTGRTEKEFASVYGYFVNPLPLHVSLAGDPSVAGLIASVRSSVLGGLDHQEYPFVLLVDELGLPHDPSRSAVFQAMFILLVHQVSAVGHGHRLEYVELPEEEGQFDLTLSVYEDEAEQRFHCVLKYNCDLFDAATVARLTRHYVSLLDGLTSVPQETPVHTLELISRSERQEIVEHWSGSGRTVPTGPPVPELILQAAHRSPETIAVVPASGTGPLTYRDLADRSGAAAHRLRALGIGPGSVVALALDKTPDLFVVLLAVWRAGAAYLPLDPHDPPARLNRVIRTAGAGLIVVGSAPSPLSGAPVRTLDELVRPGPGLDEPVGLAEPDSAAYVVQTSGSSGTPKAVQVSHRNLAAVTAAWRQEYRLDSDVRTHLQLAGFPFDVFTGDLARALSTGGTLVLADRDLLFDPARLLDTVEAHGVHAAEFVPAVVRGLIEHCERTGRRLAGLRLVVVGSDVWTVGEYRKLQELCGPGTRLVNSYGLSEATIDSTYFEGSVEGLPATQTVPIGRPFPNSAVYVLDRHRQVVPPGVVGELWVGGSGVAGGYVGDTRPADGRFVQHPAGRFYRTGDSARWSTRGELELTGRTDSQVKIRGHRIEPGEIETQLTDWPPVSRAAVGLRPGPGGEQVLCAYLVLAEGRTLERRALRSHLSAHLPTFMIPALVLELPQLPLSANGKVDLGALAAHPGAGPWSGPAPGDDPPATLYEQETARHWAALLDCGECGRGEDFFELGGNSIRLIELIYLLQSDFGVQLPVSELFRVSTLEGMAQALEQAVTGQAGLGEPFLTFNRDAPEPLFCFPPAGGHGLVYRGFAGHLPGHRLIAFNYLPGPDKVRRYAELVRGLQPHGPYRLLGYSLGGNLAFEVGKELERGGHRVSGLVMLDAYRTAGQFELTGEHLARFEEELAGHVRLHTGTDAVTEDLLRQARDYLEFSSVTPNTGTVAAPITVILDETKAAVPAATGSWQGCSAGPVTVLAGSGDHAQMLGAGHLPHNAALARQALTGARDDG
ncbi:non-ribosomal peptide synthetase/type I polyketide synthase [Kineosporia babensis]|uniref:Amino acid adenylation domain-containing protein n=1 Tax=Kineosporia babensis TaxID=499548 RepID=A0A9X1NKC1_9ACTN|nr:non-ribosomal peptide synthetase/type I polyketide synthase [Kineosporia babensis]MCD5315840.1 amino acid adenylation domain-containing protein [Kineosporia babensis]